MRFSLRDLFSAMTFTSLLTVALISQSTILFMPLLVLIALSAQAIKVPRQYSLRSLLIVTTLVAVVCGVVAVVLR